MENVVNTVPLTEEPTEPVVSEGATEPVKAGDKTDPSLLLKSLQEEREKRRLAEEERDIALNQLNSSVSSEPEEYVSRAEFVEVKNKLAKSEVIESHPQLKEVWSEFESFRTDPDNKGMNMKTAAKAFLVEKGLFDQPRKGLEKATGGPRTPISTGMSNDDVTNLRTTNYRKYMDMLKKGQIKID